MKNLFKKIIRMARLDTIIRRYLAPLLMGQRYSMNFPPYNKQVDVQIRSSVDPIRYGMMALAIQNIQEESIEGNFAEVGVFVHDYQSTEKGVKQAVTEFLKTRPERPIAIPDVQGSIVIRNNK